MLVELGNPSPRHAPDGGTEGPRVTYASFDESVYQLDLGANVDEIARHLLANPSITRLGEGLEPFLSIAHPLDGSWAAHSAGTPSWVRANAHDDRQAREMERLLSELYGCPIVPWDEVAWNRQLEDSHFTANGMPGVGFDPLGGVVALKTNAGNDIQAQQMFGFKTVFGQSGTATATTATSLTGGTETPGGSHATDDAKGMIIVAGVAYGLVTTNTSGTSPVYTIDRWYVPGSPGGAAAATPSATATYVLVAGSPPAWFMGLTANTGAPASGDTTLAGEITTAGGGLIRKICPLAHTAGTNVQTLTPVFTGNGSDSYPVTVHKIGVSQSLLSGTNQLFQTVPNADSTFAASGDQGTYTETVTM